MYHLFNKLLLFNYNFWPIIPISSYLRSVATIELMHWYTIDTATAHSSEKGRSAAAAEEVPEGITGVLLKAVGICITTPHQHHVGVRRQTNKPSQQHQESPLP